MERNNIMDNKRQVKHLTANSKGIVRLKPRNPEERNSSGIIVKALTDFREDQVTFMMVDLIVYKCNIEKPESFMSGLYKKKWYLCLICLFCTKIKKICFLRI